MKLLSTAAMSASLAAVAVLSGCAVYPVGGAVYADEPVYYRGGAPGYYEPAPYGSYYGGPPVYYGPGPVIINRGNWDRDRRGDRDRWERDHNGRGPGPGGRPPQGQPPVAQPGPRPQQPQQQPPPNRPPRGPSTQGGGGPDDLPFPGMGRGIRRND